MTATIFEPTLAAAAPRVRCGHKATYEFPFFGALEARCWRTVHPGYELCLHHLERSEHHRALCPAPAGLLRCMASLPCREHDVRDATIGYLRYGHTFIETRLPSPRPRWSAAETALGVLVVIGLAIVVIGALRG